MESLTILDILDNTPHDKIYLTSDWHFGITRFKHERNFVNVNDIYSWCSKNIKDDDVFMYLGDISYRYASEEYQREVQERLKKLPGIKVLLVGNHDEMVGEWFYSDCGFDYVFHELKWNKYVFTHKPIIMDTYADDMYNIHGHIHNLEEYNTTDGSRNINVFPMHHNNRPITLKYIEDHMEQLTKNNKRSDWVNMGESTIFTKLQSLASAFFDANIQYRPGRNNGKQALQEAIFTEAESRANLADSEFGIPEDRKFPLDSEDHVRSAIKLFGHAEASKKPALARRIKKAADNFGIEIPDTCQCSKYLEACMCSNSNFIATDDDGVFNLNTSDISWWYVSLSPHPANSLDEEQFHKTLQGAIKQYIDIDNFKNNYDAISAYVFTCNGDIEDEEGCADLTLIPMGKILVAPDLSYQWQLQYPIKVGPKGRLHTVKEFSSSYNPIIPTAKSYVVMVNPVNTDDEVEPQEYAFSPDIVSDKYVVVDENAQLKVVDSKDYSTKAVYEFVGNQNNIEKLKTAYAEGKTVDKSFIYTTLANKPLLSKDQIAFDTSFEEVDLGLFFDKEMARVATLAEKSLQLEFPTAKPMAVLESKGESLDLWSDPQGFFYKDPKTGWRTSSNQTKIHEDYAKKILFNLF